MNNIKSKLKFIDPKQIKYKYPLLEKGLSKADLQKGINVLKTGFITMGNHTEMFEKLLNSI